MQTVNPPAISVILPVYNGERYVVEAVASILQQTMADFELLVIDDGSTDGSLALLSSFGDPRLRVIENGSNRGLVYSLNAALSQARGWYIARMDADDIAHPSRLQQQWQFMEAHPDVGLCGSWAQAIGSASHLITVPVEDSEIRATMFFDCPFVHPSVMIRARVLQALQPVYRPVQAEDYDLWCRLAGHCRMHNIAEPLLSYRLHPQQITAASVDKVFHGAMAVRFAQAEALLGRQLDSRQQSALVALNLGRSPSQDVDAAVQLALDLVDSNRESHRYSEPVFGSLVYRKLRGMLGRTGPQPLAGRLAFAAGVSARLVAQLGIRRAAVIIWRYLNRKAKHRHLG